MNNAEVDTAGLDVWRTKTAQVKLVRFVQRGLVLHVEATKIVLPNSVLLDSASLVSAWGVRVIRIVVLHRFVVDIVTSPAVCYAFWIHIAAVENLEALVCQGVVRISRNLLTEGDIQALSRNNSGDIFSLFPRLRSRMDALEL